MPRLIVRGCLVLCALVSVPAWAGEPLRVAVAANFHGTLQQLAPRLQRAAAEPFEISSAATGVLYQQIRQGAPFDLFLAADERHPLLLEEEGLTLPGSRKTYAIGQLVLAGGPPGRPPPLTAVARPRQRIALPNPLLAPYGNAARAWMETMGFWEAARPRLRMASSVAQAAQMLDSAAVDLAFTAEPVARLLTRHSYQVLPAEDYPPIAQQAVVLRRSLRPAAAQKVLDVILGKDIQASIVAAGYRALPP